MTRTLVCKSCDKLASFEGLPGAINVGEVAQATGFKFVFADEHTIWLCEPCYKEVQSLALEIKKRLKQSDIKVSSCIGFRKDEEQI